MTPTRALLESWQQEDFSVLEAVMDYCLVEADESTLDTLYTGDMQAFDVENDRFVEDLLYCEEMKVVKAMMLFLVTIRKWMQLILCSDEASAVYIPHQDFEDEMQGKDQVLLDSYAAFEHVLNTAKQFVEILHYWAESLFSPELEARYQIRSIFRWNRQKNGNLDELNNEVALFNYESISRTSQLKDEVVQMRKTLEDSDESMSRESDRSRRCIGLPPDEEEHMNATDDFLAQEREKEDLLMQYLGLIAEEKLHCQAVASQRGQDIHERLDLIDQQYKADPVQYLQVLKAFATNLEQERGDEGMDVHFSATDRMLLKTRSSDLAGQGEVIETVTTQEESPPKALATDKFEPHSPVRTYAVGSADGRLVQASPAKTPEPQDGMVMELPSPGLTVATRPELKKSGSGSVDTSGNCSRDSCRAVGCDGCRFM